MRGSPGGQSVPPDVDSCGSLHTWWQGGWQESEACGCSVLLHGRIGWRRALHSPSVSCSRTAQKQTEHSCCAQTPPWYMNHVEINPIFNTSMWLD